MHDLPIANKLSLKQLLLSYFIIQLIVFISLFPNKALAKALDNPTIINMINHTSQYSTSEYLACEAMDPYWFEKSSFDFVNIPKFESSSIVIKADNVEAKESSAYLASGNVVVYSEDKTLNANWINYNQKTSKVSGGESIVLTRQYDTIKGKWVNYYLDLDKGIIYDASSLQYQNNMFAKGRQINFLSKKEYQVSDGLFTTCNPKNPAWHVTANQINFNYQNSEGNARGATFYASSIPILYTPFFEFPLGERKSGWLTPEIATSSDTANGIGPMIGVPYYWNMAPNYDMTITPRIYAQAGLMVRDEFRYLTNSGNGTIYTEQLPNSWQNGKYRYYWSLKDDHFLTDKLSIGYEYNQVSDDNYFVDFGNFYSNVNNINLSRLVYAKYQPKWGVASIKLQGYQTLQPSNLPYKVPSIYIFKPQINLNTNPLDINNTPLKFNLVSQYTNFSDDSNTLQRAQRTVIYPSLTMPLTSSWGFITPKIGEHFTNYELEPFSTVSPKSRTINRKVLITSLDTGLNFERYLELPGNVNFTQTLEPRIYYLYIPQVNQAAIPLFDTAGASNSINQLFSENRFVGFDRINMANDLTIGANSKLISDKGMEIYNWGIGYRYYFVPEDYVSYGNYNQFPQLYLPSPNLITELTNNWTHDFSSDITFQYTTIFNQVDAYALQLRYHPETFKMLNLRYSYQYNQPLLYYSWIPGEPFPPAEYENQYAIDVSGEWPLWSNKWLINGRANFDFTRSKWLNIITGLEYNGGCWSVSALRQSYLTNLVQPTTIYAIQLQLGGIGTVLGVNGDPISILNSNIPGYYPIGVIH